MDYIWNCSGRLGRCFVSISAPIVSDNAFASKMSGSYGCSEGPGRCHGNDSHRSFTTGAKKANAKKGTK
jgi:hypothetical protein